MPETNDIFEIMSTMRAMRRLKPDPVPDELINKILQAGQWAPSGGNTQRWRFLVVKDPEVKKKVQVYYKRLFDEQVGPRYRNSAPPPGSDPARYQRQHAAVEYLTDHYHEAPVWIVACLEGGETYRVLWQEAVAASPDYVLITSWNEWHEGSEIEPSVEYGSVMLNDTAVVAREFLGGRR